MPAISDLTLNKMTSIAIGVTREYAGAGATETTRMWSLWLSLVRNFHTSFTEVHAY